MIYHILPSFVTAFLISYFAIPSIIKIAHEKNLCDEPGERRSHASSIPTLGGIGIFAGLIFSMTFWIPFDVDFYPAHHSIQYIMAAYIIIFLIGAKDDIIPLSPRKKFIGQILAAAILIAKADVRLSSFYGVFGIGELDIYSSYILSLFVILLIINALNLIDGINGLAGSVGALAALSFGTWFYLYGRLDLAVLAASLLGSILAFLRYNMANPAKIFMGDTGSLLLGMSSAILAIQCIELNKTAGSPWFLESVPALAIAVLIIPLFDTLRVFTLRLAKGRSPFSPDRNHLHHLLLDVGCSHLQATGLLIGSNILCIVLAYNLRQLGTLKLSLLLLALALLFTALLLILRRKKRLLGA